MLRATLRRLLSSACTCMWLPRLLPASSSNHESTPAVCGKGGRQYCPRDQDHARARPHGSRGPWCPRSHPTHAHGHTLLCGLCSCGLAASVLPLVGAPSPWPHLLSFLGPLSLPHHPPPSKEGPKFLISLTLGVISLSNITKRQKSVLVRGARPGARPLGVIPQLCHLLAI